MRPVCAILAGLSCWASGCGTPAPPPAAAEAPAGRAAVHRVVEGMQAEQARLKGAWQRSASEGKTPAPADFIFVEVSMLEKVDLTGCPADFTDVFRGLIRARQRQLRAANKYKAEVPQWEAWVAIERQGDAPDLPAHEREIAAAGAAYGTAWDELGRVCARYK